jgi:uncharacterized protein YndB with AHSA1/START domain
VAARPDPNTTIELSRDFDAPPELVFDAFCDAKALTFIFSTDGYKIVEMKVDARVGGGWNLAMRDEATGNIARCTSRYLEIARPKRIVCTNTWLDGPLASEPETRVTLEFEKIARGTRLTLMHEFFPDRQTCDQHSNGWASAFSKLAQYLATTASVIQGDVA